MFETAERPATAGKLHGETAKKRIRHFRNLDVYQNRLGAGLRVYDITKTAIRRFAEA